MIEIENEEPSRGSSSTRLCLVTGGIPWLFGVGAILLALASEYQVSSLQERISES